MGEPVLYAQLNLMEVRSPTPNPTSQPKGDLSKTYRLVFAVLLLICVILGIYIVYLQIEVSSLRSANRTAEDPSSWSDKRREGSSVCPDGWISLNRTCYTISEEKKSWEESRQRCVELQGDLAIIGPSQTILTGYIQNLQKEFWVGLRKEKRDLYIGELWYWVDNTIQENIPEDSADLCVKLGERLSPESCSSQLPRICQRPEGK